MNTIHIIPIYIYIYIYIPFFYLKVTKKIFCQRKSNFCLENPVLFRSRSFKNLQLDQLMEGFLFREIRFDLLCDTFSFYYSLENGSRLRLLYSFHTCVHHIPCFERHTSFQKRLLIIRVNVIVFP